MLRQPESVAVVSQVSDVSASATDAAQQRLGAQTCKEHHHERDVAELLQHSLLQLEATLWA